MKKTIWYMHKPGDARDYAMTTLPTPEWAQAQYKDGFHLYAVEIEVPTLAPTTGTLKGQVHKDLERFGPQCTTHGCLGCSATFSSHHAPDCPMVLA